jgi:hypothetical protein
MGNRGLMVLATVVAVVAVGGIGFAAFTTTAYVNGYAQAGSLNLFWTNAGEPTPSSSYVTCTAAITMTSTASDTLAITATNLAPGDQCKFTATLNNGGNIPANVYDQLSLVPVVVCNWYIFDNFGGHSYPPLEAPLGPIPITSSTPLAYSLTVGFWAGQGNLCENAPLQFTLTFTATAGS